MYFAGNWLKTPNWLRYPDAQAVEYKLCTWYMSWHSVSFLLVVCLRFIVYGFLLPAHLTHLLLLFCSKSSHQPKYKSVTLSLSYCMARLFCCYSGALSHLLLLVYVSLFKCSLVLASSNCYLLVFRSSLPNLLTPHLSQIHSSQACLCHMPM